MGRHHRNEETRPAFTWPQKLLALGLMVAAIATVIGLVVQWPPNEDPPVSDAFSQTSGMTGELVEGTVAIVQPGMCGSSSVGQAFEGAPVTDPNAPAECTHAIVDLTSGPDEGQRTLLEVRPDLPGNPDLQPGDEITLSTHVAGEGYAFQDFQRSGVMWAWITATVALIVLVGAWRGARSIVGLAITLGVIVVFLIPGLVHGGSPVLLALTCGAAVLFAVLFLVHGVSWKTASAMGGTLLALGLSVILSTLAVHSAGIRGLGDDNNLNILIYLPGVSISGLMLAGMIVGALGVLNDVTIAQASTVNEMSELDPDASAWQLFRSAMRVGRDHIASMVYTLVLSYTGVALPTLLLLSVSGRPLEQVLTSDIMATEILRSVTGAMALVLAVPLTTAIAALTVRDRIPQFSA
ncbi:MAG TPA: YibE/F family protein [Candidatus Corynebacterium gallistercoris]|uniref:YibE/F family protein n=1 Tax=Candidatus Corynebacterium gallistercoris TaxID=2838530 RepID=A0A9D1RWN7_9CORY|nr:YibE/F family protein [Candidatus Corynebacterium gallistercoris]